MKTIFNLKTVRVYGLWLLAFCILIISMLLLQSCSKKDDPQPETERLAELLKANTWKMQSVLVDGTDKTTVYTGLTLAFTATNYTTTNGGVVWPASGTWSFADQTGKTITRSDDVSISVEEVSTTRLILKLTWSKTTLGGGRVNSVSGVHVFTFEK